MPIDLCLFLQNALTSQLHQSTILFVQPYIIRHLNAHGALWGGRSIPFRLNTLPIYSCNCLAACEMLETPVAYMTPCWVFQVFLLFAKQVGITSLDWKKISKTGSFELSNSQSLADMGPYRKSLAQFTSGKISESQSIRGYQHLILPNHKYKQVKYSY